MDVSHPIRSIVPSLDGAVLEVLAGTTRPLTGREVARLSGGSVSGVRLVLQRLVLHGIIHREDRGPSSFYTANRDHLAWSAIQQLLTLGTRLEDNIVSRVKTWTIQPESLALFGSVARGDAGPGSDIDLLIIEPRTVTDRAAWDTQISDLGTAVENWSGNTAHITTLTRDGLTERSRQADPLLDSWSAEARTLVGRDIRELI
ncbi:MAG TPA: nucleotidyltransferase domain-containing protein [Terrimesophilobacter sp.]|nr:nucleotidyltransferase domain-containing protein [Terrimesophilobacter sp.]HRP99154.1 nucleotidyltransferase domain-containing protein [Terrimesophilobacter sp.]